jgi:hypothetical protein
MGSILFTKIASVIGFKRVLSKDISYEEFVFEAKSERLD